MSEPTSIIELPWVLLAIIAVDKADRVQCQCKGCGHGIYAAIHMVALPNGEIECWGSDCYSRQAGLAHVPSTMPMFPSLNGRRLSEAEREQLRVNRQKLVEQFKKQQEEDQRRRDEAERIDSSRRAETVAREGEAIERMRNLRTSIRTRRVPVEGSESVRSAYDLPERRCVLCGQVTTEWWTNVGAEGCKCKACLKAGKS